MAGFVAGFEEVVVATPSALWLIALALAAVLFANTYLLSLNTGYRWQYGLFRFIAYFGMAVLTYTTGGVASVIPTLSAFLGMELQRLMTQLDLQFHFVKEKATKFVSFFKKTEK